MLNRDQIRRNARDFAENFAETTSEKKDKDRFWIAFYEVFGIPTHQVNYFEKEAVRVSTENLGWIDLLHPGQMGVEHKSRGEDLDAAMDQLLDYLPSLPDLVRPWLLVACDFETFRWTNNANGQHGEFQLANLEDHLDLFWWIAGGETPHEAHRDEIDVNLDAVKLLADLHDELASLGYQERHSARWLTRLLFCLFADDTEIWPQRAFEIYLAENSSEDGANLGRLIHEVFELLDTAPSDRMTNLPQELRGLRYINGDLFAAPHPPSPTCNKEVRDAVLKACQYNWSKVSPAIFGSLFQGVMDPSDRRELGAHYTSEVNIHRALDPLVFDELQRELMAAQTKPAVQRFLDKLGTLTFFDPACGCGNFLVVAYQQLRQLELEGLRKLRTVGTIYEQRAAEQMATTLDYLCQVKVDQFYGLEINEFSAEIARTALYLADHVANRAVSAEFGETYVRFPIPNTPTIRCANALTTDWNELLSADRADYVVGNPPFAGHSKRTDAQTTELKQLWDDSYNKLLDYVTAWFVKAIDYGKGQNTKFSFVATSSVTRGEQADGLFSPLFAAGFNLDFAVRTFKWTNEARGKATVSVVILGFSDNGGENGQHLFDIHDLDDLETDERTRVKIAISPYLVDDERTPVRKISTPLSPNMPACNYGSLPADGKHLQVTAEELAKLDAATQKWIRPYVGSKELMNSLERYVIWAPDGIPAAELSASPFLQERLNRVKDSRLASDNPDTRDLATSPYRFFHVNQPTTNYLAIPAQVSDDRSFFTVDYLPPSTIASNTMYTAEDPTGLLFALLSSSMFFTWISTTGGGRARLRYAVKVVHNTFPVPAEIPDKQVKAVIASGLHLREVRGRFPGESLSSLYQANAMPHELVNAHKDIDRAVDKVFGRKRDRYQAKDRFAVLIRHYRHLINPAEPLQFPDD